MTSYVTSADGTEIAYDRLGEGPPIVVIGGLFNTRETTRALAEELATALTAISFDRRGRGDSGDAATYSVQREVEDVAALIDEVGGGASVYGHSSGAGLALQAAAAGLPITRLVVHEPPFSEAMRRACIRPGSWRRTSVARSRRIGGLTRSPGSWWTWACRPTSPKGSVRTPPCRRWRRRCSTTSP